MNSSNKAVVALFALAVVAALAAVAWLVLDSAPRSEPGIHPPVPPVKSGAKDPVPPPRDPRTGRNPPRVKQGKVTAWEVAGLVKGPDGAAAADAEVAVFPGVSRDVPLAPSTASSTSTEKIPEETLRELFSLDPDDLAATSLYSGVPVLPTAAAPEKETAHVRTGPDGAFRVPVKFRGPFRLVARKEGVGHAVVADVQALDAAVGGAGVTLTLGPASTLAGRVVNGAGGAVEGAVVVIRSGSSSRGATSGPDGAFAIQDLVPGKYVLDAGAQGLAPASLAAVEVPAAAPLEVVLGAGYAVRVTVAKREVPVHQPGMPNPNRNAVFQGPPVEGALVVLYHRQSRTYRSAVTGADGTVRIDRLGTGQWLLSARKEGFLVGLGKVIHFRTGSPPEETREVKMYASVPTPIRVLDENGLPIRAAKVFTGGLDIEYDPRHSVQVGKTDDEGRISFAFDDGIPWKGILWIVPEDGGAVVKVEPDDPTSGEEVRAVVRPGRVIQGTVSDQRGRPVKGAQVLVNVTNDEPEVDVGLYAYTDEKGVYRFPALPFGDVSLEVDADGEWDTQDIEAEVKDNPLVRDFKIEVEEK